ncbi:hypothetical protein BHE74_00025181 [Ensete ventricosum]|nr:hypothetical protein BHE74_00025181 [Ensete ventricosum]
MLLLGYVSLDDLAWRLPQGPARRTPLPSLRHALRAVRCSSSHVSTSDGLSALRRPTPPFIYHGEAESSKERKATTCGECWGTYALTMAEHSEESVLTEEIQQKPRGHDSSSSLSSGPDAEKPGPSPSVKVTPYRLFSRERPVHQVLGSGRTADVMLWRNKKISAGVLTGGTAIWALSPPRIPEVNVSEEQAIKVASNMRNGMNRASGVLREIALGHDLKKFLAVPLMTLLTVPVLYEKYEDKIDASAEKAMTGIKQQYAVFDAKVLSMIRRRPPKAKKH